MSQQHTKLHQNPSHFCEIIGTEASAFSYPYEGQDYTDWYQNVKLVASIIILSLTETGQYTFKASQCQKLLTPAHENSVPSPEGYPTI